MSATLEQPQTQQQVEIEKLIQVIRLQREVADLPAVVFGHHDLICDEEERHHAVSPRPESIETFAERIHRDGWIAWGDKAYCGPCRDRENEVSEYEAYICQKVSEARER